MYMDYIQSRIIYTIGYKLLFLMRQTSVSLILIFGTMDALIVVIGMLEIREMKIPPIMKSNIQMPSTFHNIANLIWLFVQIGCLLGPTDFVCTILGWRNLKNDLWVRLCALELLTISYLYYRSMKKHCTIFIYGKI